MNKPSNALRAIGLATALWLSGCAGIVDTRTPSAPLASSQPDGATPNSTLQPEGTPMPDTSPHQSMIDHARHDLAARRNVAVEDIRVVSAESVIWPDKSLGCPRPGMLYAQVQQDGMRIELETEGRTFVYHSGGARKPFLCEAPQMPPHGNANPATNQ